MKDLIAVVKMHRENKRLLAMKNTDKTVITEIAKVSSVIDF